MNTWIWIRTVYSNLFITQSSSAKYIYIFNLNSLNSAITYYIMYFMIFFYNKTVKAVLKSLG